MKAENKCSQYVNNLINTYNLDLLYKSMHTKLKYKNMKHTSSESSLALARERRWGRTLAVTVTFYFFKKMGKVT